MATERSARAMDATASAPGEPLVTGDAFYDSPLVSWRVTDPLVLTGLAQTVHRLPANEMPPLVPPDKVLDREGFAD